ncbi:four helix bundle protein [Alcanivorax sp.]|uniref:four helix bundle protein n=1 Tax=Alcanivorax sp. TaxID=1872427 RepID=UPI003A93942A
MSRKYQRLNVWRGAMELAEQVYLITRHFPDEERFGLSQQMRRASVSVASNIAEGSDRGTDKDFVRFLYIARGSLQELETQLFLSSRLAFHDELEKLNQDVDRIYAMLNNLIQALKSA